MGPSQIKKQKFIDSHLAVAEKGASQLNVHVSYLLATSALESDYGVSRFAQNGNNFFGQHYPAPYSNSYILAGNGIKLAKFNNFEDSMNSFVEQYGAHVRNVSAPEQFARNLQDAGAFGIPSTGGKVSYYVSEMVSINRTIQSNIAFTRSHP